MSDHMLTTVDNPFDPFVQWDEWFNFDVTQGHYTCAYLARLADPSSDLSPDDQSTLIDSAIEQILKDNPNGLYRLAINNSKS